MTPGELRRRIMGKEPPGETPDWVILSGEIRSLTDALRADVARAAERFEGFDDVRRAIAHRDRETPKLRARVTEINKLVKELNLIVPHMRFQMVALDADVEVAPLARSYFKRR